MTAQEALDPATAHLIRFSAAVAWGEKAGVGEAAAACHAAGVPTAWVEEMLLQSVLMTGYPRALVAFAAWREVSGPVSADDPVGPAEWTRRGEQCCEVVYGANYQKLRDNVRALHPALDHWMIAEGYGRTLARPGLDLRRRELCIVAQTAVLDTPRQLHSHLRGALHTGATPAQIDTVLQLVRLLLPPEGWEEVQELWRTVRAGP